MMTGNATFCVSCGSPVRSCVIPAYCFQCDPFLAHVRKAVEEAETEAECDTPSIVVGDE